MLKRAFSIVLQDDAEIRFIAGDQFVSTLAFRELEPMSNQGPHIDAIFRHQIEKSFDVPAFSPAHVTERIIVSAFFVFRIVAARAIRH